MKFKYTSTIAASVSFALFLSLLLAPQLIFDLFSVASNDSAYFFTRRAAMLFLGYSLISFSSRRAPHSEARQAICLGLGSAMLTLAALGLFELSRAYAGPGILVAITGELFLAAAYLSTWFSHRKTS